MRILGYVLCFLSLCMPWCWGYLMEALRPSLADAAIYFGLMTGALGLACLMFGGKDEN